MSDSKKFYMPGEWSEHENCWMAWPPEQRRDIYPNLDDMRRQYADVASAIAEFEPVMLLATTETADDARRHCSGKVEVIAAKQPEHEKKAARTKANKEAGSKA